MPSGQKEYQCMDCGKSFTRRSSLMVHQRIHTGEKLFMCTDCGKWFSLKSSLVRHLKTHLPKTLKICPVCGKCFSRYSNLFQHQKVHTKDKGYKCLYCEKSFPRASQLVVHQRVHKQRSLLDGQENDRNLEQRGTRKKFFCLECGKYFKEQRFLTRHRRIHEVESPSTFPLNQYDGLSHDIPFNADEDYEVPQTLQTVNSSDQVTDGSFYAKKETREVKKPILCMDCGKSFTRKSSLVVHQRTHTGEKLFMCTECGKKFSLKSSLVRHIRAHCPNILQHKKVRRREKRYKCLQCEKSFSRSSQLTTHERTHKAEIFYPKSEPKNSDFEHKEDFKDAKDSYKCPECGRFFRRQSSLLRHQRIHKGRNLSTKWSQVGEKQTVTGHEKLSPPFLRIRRQLRTQNVFHPVAESEGNCSTSAPDHEEDTELTQDLPDVTEKLNPSINENSYIDVKIGDNTAWKTSNEAKSNMCTDCGKSFTRKASLIVHQRTHTGEKLFMCIDCGKRFSLKSSLVRHMRNHCSKMLNICSDCGKYFSRYSSLFRHQKVHKKQKSHKCPHCEKSFSRASQLVFHQKTHKLEKSHPVSDPEEDTDELGKPNSCVSDSCAEEPPVCLESAAPSSEEHHQKVHTSDRYTNPDNNDDAGKPVPEIYSEKHKSQDVICNVLSIDPEPVTVAERECAKSNSICNPRLSRTPYHCIQCGKKFTRKSYLMVHQNIHTGEKPYICIECGRRFTFKSCLFKHQKSHTRYKLNVCSECGIYFSRHCDLLLHLENHTAVESCKANMQQSANEDKDDVTVASTEEEESSLIQKDRQLNDKGCFSIGLVDSSIKQETSKNLSAEPTKSQKNEDECTDPCALSLKNEPNISESVTEGYTRKTYKTEKHSKHPILNVLNNHNLGEDIWDESDQVKKKPPSREKCYFCLECGKSFTRNSSLNVHQRIHTGEKLFMCIECGSRFGLKSSLVRHMRSHNTEDL